MSAGQGSGRTPILITVQAESRPPARTIVTVVLSTTLVVAGAVFASYVLTGRTSPHALMNIEGIVSLAFLVLVFVRSVPRVSCLPQRHASPLGRAAVAIAIVSVACLAFAGNFRVPFVYDDYTHITEASRANWKAILAGFGPAPHRPGLFFRPAGFLFYWFNYLAARFDPVAWHASSIALHSTCGFLVYLLGSELGLTQPACIFAAFLFLLHGGSAETVTWVDARFDLIATALVLLSLLCVCRYVREQRTTWRTAALAAGALAMLSKESAFCLPLLIACLAVFRDKAEVRRVWAAAAWAGAVAIVLFSYRWWALGGIGGYRSSAGVPYVIQMGALHTVNVLLLRGWAILLFPFNWTWPASLTMRLVAIALPLILTACALLSRAPTRLLLGSIAFTVVAELPVQHLLLVGPDLSGMRNVYLASIGLAIACGLLWNGSTSRAGVLATCSLLVVHVLMLEHNLAAWRSTAGLARAVCADLGRTVAHTPGEIVVSGLPSTRNGVVFLANGFEECVAMNSGVPANRIHVIGEHGAQGTHEPGAQQFLWNESTSRLERLTTE